MGARSGACTTMWNRGDYRAPGRERGNGDGNEDEDGSGHEDRDGCENKSKDGDEKREEGGGERESGNPRRGNRGGSENVRGGETPTSNQEPQRQDPTP